MESAVRYAIGDLARLAGVSRRTVRYYVQEGLIPAPHGVGRGNHYGPEHLDQILRVKAMQESGRTLDDIRYALARGTARGSKPRRAAEPAFAKATAGRPAAFAKATAGRPAAFAKATAGRPAAFARTTADRLASPERSLWRRLTLAPGVELHISSDVRLPRPGQLQELATWCRLHLVPHTEEEGTADDA
jgi:DNA-binding transcriptional MerR regulator